MSYEDYCFEDPWDSLDRDQDDGGLWYHQQYEVPDFTQRHEAWELSTDRLPSKRNPDQFKREVLGEPESEPEVKPKFDVCPEGYDYVVFKDYKILEEREKAIYIAVRIAKNRYYGWWLPRSVCLQRAKKIWIRDWFWKKYKHEKLSHVCLGNPFKK